MYEKISVLVPTRQRVERLKVLLESYWRTARSAGLQRGDSEMIFRIDDDDAETRDFLLDQGGVKFIIGPRMRGYRSMPAFFNELFEASTGDVLMCGNDDMVFKTAHWPRLILHEASRFPDGVFDIGVATHNETHFPFSIVSRIVAGHLGFLWDPAIFWGDIYLRDIMAHFGRAVMLPSVKIEHDWAGFRPDKTFDESDKNITLHDRDYWTVTHRRAVDSAVRRLEELL